MIRGATPNAFGYVPVIIVRVPSSTQPHSKRRIQFAAGVSERSELTGSWPGPGTEGAPPHKRPGPARRKKSIRITLEDDERDAKSDLGSISTMLERRIRFEDSPTTPVTPLDSAASNETSIFDDKVWLARKSCVWRVPGLFS